MDALALVSSDESKRATIEAVPEHVAAILGSGGLVPHLRSRMEKDR